MPARLLHLAVCLLFTGPSVLVSAPPPNARFWMQLQRFITTAKHQPTLTSSSPFGRQLEREQEGTFGNFLGSYLLASHLFRMPHPTSGFRDGVVRLSHDPQSGAVARGARYPDVQNCLLNDPLRSSASAVHSCCLLTISLMGFTARC